MRNQRQAVQSNHFIPWLLALLASCVAAVGVYFIDQAEGRRYQQELRSQTLDVLSTVRADMEGRLNSDLQLFAGLVVQLSLHPESSEEEIERTISHLMAKRELVRSIGISKKYVVTQVYPLKGNEAAIGLNYLANESQREPVLRAVESKAPVLAGPVHLVQGGQALIGRLPVFTTVPYGDEEAGAFWGIVSVVLNMDRLYRLVGINQLPIDIAIRGNDGMGRYGDVFFGEEELFDQSIAKLDLILPGGKWRMAARPNQGLLGVIPDRRPMFLVLGALVVLLFGLFVFLVSRQLKQQKAMLVVQEQSQREIWHAATHDPLTGMINRSQFSEELNHSIAQARRDQTSLAVLFLDLDGFKKINDSFGHRIGDLYLQSFAEKLQKSVRESEIVARLGGDEFGIIASDVEGVDEVAKLSQRVIDAMGQPIQVEYNSLQGGVSVGVALFPNDGDSVDDLLQNADMAMYSAKDDPLSSYAFFDDQMNREAQARKRLVEDIQKGIDRDEYSLVYQPIVDAIESKVIGVETLVRWEQPERGWVSPGEFIPVAEMSGLIIPLGRWIMHRAAQETMRWTKALDQQVKLSVNLSAIQLHRGDPLRLVQETVEQTGISPEALDVEITESAILDDVDKATQVVKSLREFGASVTIDDFGTGYSSLSHLRHLPVNRIKIDLSFVRLIGKDHHSEAIIKAILFLSQTLQVRVTAEGVETEAQLAFLKDLGCNEIQGYYFSKPRLASEIPGYIEQLSKLDLS